MKKTNKIKKSVEMNKSLIEGAKLKRKQEEDDKEITRQVDLIKNKSIMSRRSQKRNHERINSQSGMRDINTDNQSQAKMV